nr:MAG TPA: hypothetical protein [Caudoviricetes sp.]
MEKYNNLTRRLLDEGYTAENYPKDKVHIAGGCYSQNGNPLDNIYGGFEYNRIYCDAFTYKTGCGMHVVGKNVINSMGFCGEEWCHENDNPVIRCPYDKPNCPMNDERLLGIHGGGICIQCFCVCHKTEEHYDYENSFEKEEKKRQEEKNQKYQEYTDAHNGRICSRHMIYNERTREWHMIYEPYSCAKMCYSQDGYCPVLGRELSKKRGNVYYDLKTSGTVKQQEAQCSMFDGEQWTHIEKGMRVFDKPCSMDICEAFVKVQSDEILHNYEVNHSTEYIFDKSFKAEILNIRAESKPSRDLIQDLQDIKDGITIVHASDSEKRMKEQKKERRKLAQQKKIAKLEKVLIDVGYENLEPYSMNRVHADKWLDPERLEELEQLRQQKIKEEQEKPVQLSLFD